MNERELSSAGQNRGRGFRRRWIAVAVAVAVIVGVAIVVATNLADKQAGPVPVEALGTITSINGSNITVNSSGLTTKPPSHAVKVVISASTRFILHAAGTLSDVQSGDNVLVMGATTEPVISAQEIIDGGTTFEDNQRGLRGTPPPPTENSTGTPPDATRQNGGPPLAGIVNGVHGNSFSLSRPDGSTVNVNALASTITVLKASSLDALHVGDLIRVAGMSGANDTIAATSIHSRAG